MKYETTMEVKVTLHYDYSPEEPREQWYPGCPAEVDVWDMTVEPWDSLPQSAKEELIEAIHEHERNKRIDDAEYAEEYIRDSGIFALGVGLVRTYRDMERGTR